MNAANSTMEYQCSINVQAMSNGPIANSEHLSTGDLFSQLMDLTSSKKLVAAVAEKPLELPDNSTRKPSCKTERDSKFDRNIPTYV